MTKVAAVDGVANAVDPFITASLNNLQTGALADLAGNEQASGHAHLFVCGAIIYLSNYDAIDKVSTNQLVTDKLKKHFDLDDPAAAAVIERVNKISPKDSGHIFLLEGASALRRWVAHDDKAAGQKLGKLLQ